MISASAPLKLVSINIEGRRHLDTVLPFLTSESADMVCLQEAYEPDFAMIANVLGMRGMFAPMTLLRVDKKTGPHIPWGVGILTGLPCSETQEHYYYGMRKPVPVFVDNIKTLYKVFIAIVVQKDGASYTVGTTHFTWTPDGQADVNQRRDLPALLAVVKKFPEIVFCGDFNAPRGREIFTKIAGLYKDNIPQTYDTSIDGKLHRDGPLHVMVDGLFTTPHYTAKNVRLVSGVSDHCAIVADIDKQKIYK